MGLRDKLDDRPPRSPKEYPKFLLPRMLKLHGYGNIQKIHIPLRYTAR